MQYTNNYDIIGQRISWSYRPRIIRADYPKKEAERILHAT